MGSCGEGWKLQNRKGKKLIFKNVPSGHYQWEGGNQCKKSLSLYQHCSPLPLAYMKCASLLKPSPNGHKHNGYDGKEF